MMMLMMAATGGNAQTIDRKSPDPSFPIWFMDCLNVTGQLVRGGDGIRWKETVKRAETESPMYREAVLYPQKGPCEIDDKCRIFYFRNLCKILCPRIWCKPYRLLFLSFGQSTLSLSLAFSVLHEILQHKTCVFVCMFNVWHALKPIFMLFCMCVRMIKDQRYDDVIHE